MAPLSSAARAQMRQAVTLLSLLFAIYSSLAAHCDFDTNTCYSNSGKPLIGCKCKVHTREEWISMSTNPKWVPPETGSGIFQAGPGTKILFDFRQYPNKTYVWFAESAPRYPSHNDIIAALEQTQEYQSTSSKWFRCDWQSYADVDGSILFAMTINAGTSTTMMKMLVETVTPVLPLAKVERHGWVSIYDNGSQNFDQSTIDYYKAHGQEIHYLKDLQAQGAPTFFTTLRPGDAYGHLKLFPNVTAQGTITTPLNPLDIVVFDQLPLDLGVVQGTMTTIFQTVNSHINLKSAERETPNLMIFNFPAVKACMMALDGKPVHYSVHHDGWVIAPTTEEVVREKYQEKLNRKAWLSMSHAIGHEVQSYDDMCPDDDPDYCLTEAKKIFGSKAATLGYLAKPAIFGRATDVGSISHELGYDLTPIGFGIPHQYFLDFVNYPGNENLLAKIKELQHIESTTEPLPETRLQFSNEIKELFYNATMPPRIIRAVNDIAWKVFASKNITGLKFRSSANAEDMPGFDGAGLYDSMVGDYGKTSKTPCYYDPIENEAKPKTFECAIKGVYASMYNVRGIQERTFARFRHDTCTMGIAVVAQYDTWGEVSANSVVITRDIFQPDRLAYSLGIQQGKTTVTNPEPGTIAETTLAFPNPNGTFTLSTVNYATPGPGIPTLTKRVLSDEMTDLLLRIIKHAEYTYCRFHQHLSEEKCNNILFFNTKPGLDMEFKFYPDGKMHLKQLREFTGNTIQHVRLPLDANNSCSFVTAAYFDNPDDEFLLNVALKKPATATNPAASSNAAMGNDGVAALNPKTTMIATRSWKVELGELYETRYIRIVGPPSNYNATMSNFIVQLYMANNTRYNITYKSPGNYMQSPLVLPINSTYVSAVEVIGLSTATNKVAFSELQVWARPLVKGDPKDFPHKERPVTGNCTWSMWSEWSTCAPSHDPYPASIPTWCGPNTPFVGVQNRTRTGEWCETYILEPSIESRPCPIECAQHLTKVTVDDVQGKIVPSVQCYTKSIARQLWTAYFNYESTYPTTARLAKGTTANLLTYDTEMMVFLGPLISTQLEVFNPGYHPLAQVVTNTNSAGAISWTVAGTEALIHSNGTNFNRCPAESKLVVPMIFPDCPDEEVARMQLIAAFRATLTRILADHGFPLTSYDSLTLNATIELDDPSLCVKPEPSPVALTPNTKRAIVQDTTKPITGKAMLSISNPEGADPDRLIYESFDAVYQVLQAPYADSILMDTTVGTPNGTATLYAPPSPPSPNSVVNDSSGKSGLAVWVIVVIVVVAVLVVAAIVGAVVYFVIFRRRPSLESAIRMDATSSSSVSKYKIPLNPNATVY